jgi:glucose/arabinose dehydrogenase
MISDNNLAFDSFGDLWGVENGAYMISDNNPSEEMNRG